MKDPNFLTQEAGLDFNTVVGDIIKHSCIVDFGIIQNVVADGVVDVSLAVSKTPQDIVCMTCVLANIASSSVTFHIKPNVGDRVLVVYPRLFDDRMFTVPSDSQATEVIVNPEAKGYNLTSGIAILINQYKQGTHENVITIDEGKVSAKLNKVEVTTTADGDITVDNGKATINIDKDGNVSVNAQGKYTIKNSSTDLTTVISKLVDEIEGLAIVCPNGAGSINPSSVAKLELWKQQLQTLLASAPATP